MWAKTFRRSSGAAASTCSRCPPTACPSDVLLVAVGPFAVDGAGGRGAAAQPGHRRTVVDPRWVLPVPEAMVKLGRGHKLVVTVEDNGVAGGVGSTVSAALRRAEIDVPCRDVGLPQEFFAQASRGEVLAEVGLTDRNIARQITGWVAALGATSPNPQSASASTKSGPVTGARHRLETHGR